MPLKNKLCIKKTIYTTCFNIQELLFAHNLNLGVSYYCQIKHLLFFWTSFKELVFETKLKRFLLDRKWIFKYYLDELQVFEIK
jgi:hypothetical protein